MSNIVFTPQQAYVATLAMRLGRPVAIATIAGWSPQQLSAARASANTTLSQAQAQYLGVKAAGKTPGPVKPHQRMALSAWAQHGYAVPAPANCVNGLQANQALVACGQASKGQAPLVTQVYATWLAAVAAQQSGQLALF